MTADLVALTLDAHDPTRLARFWSTLLGREATSDRRGGVTLLPDDDSGFRIRFVQTDDLRSGPNQMHFELTSASLEMQRETVRKALELGGRHYDAGQLPEEEHVVLADPEGNEFCVIEPGNGFLAGCGFLGALSADGSQACGYFWSEALGWPLVWDQDQETAIRSPRGGPKIAWGGPPMAPKTGKYRLHFDLAPMAPSSQQSEVDRLLSLGASLADIGQGDVDWVVMVDPDGHELCVLPG